MMSFGTESGAIYDIDDAGEYIRRVNLNDEKRADNHWIKLMSPVDVIVGHRVFIITESIAEYGVDDHDTQLHEVSEYSTRVTTPVMWIEDN